MAIYRFFILLILVFLISCHPQDNQDENQQNVFKYNQSSAIASLDPAFAKDQATIWLANQIFNGLVQFDQQLNLQPAIAKSWDVSDNGLSYTFNLRKDVFFHDNACFPDGKARKVLATDVVYSLQRLLDPKVASPGAWIFSNNVRLEKPFEAIDDHTFRLNLERPFRPILNILSMQYCSIVPKEAVDHYGSVFRSNPVGTGPFQFKNWQEGVAIILVKNDRYFETENGIKLPYLDVIKVSFIENKRTEFLAFVKQEIDFMSGLDASYVNDLLTKDGKLAPEFKDKIKLLRSPYLNTEYLGILNESDEEEGPLHIKEVRQAINYGFDRREMIQFLRNNVGIPATAGFIPEGLPSFNAELVKGYSYDPQKAKSLLADAGFKNGVKVPEIKLYTNNSYEDMATFIARQLEDIGFTIKLELTPAAFLREMMAKGDAPFFRGSWIADYPDAESYMAMFYGKNAAPPNYTRFKNSTFDKLYEAALLENDNEKRYGLYQEMDQLLIEEAFIVPLFYDEVLRFTQKNVANLEPNPMNLLILKNVKFTK